ncbi:fatty-acyl-CoA synthase [Rhodococcus rhodochrous J45]|uniref:Fatty-acyl-CoA synthase n=1 Tax=Rhodococcus rhodochrous J45 TaxID=935266 RepID=A0A562E384_RHORH|nr:AMP-binding protein [Rhodococcus rhodochrous]TWH16247.1 fatty-acyl-CoA synthase [Rhodococcus rhodochrous J45]
MSLEMSYWPASASTGIRDITFSDLLREAAATAPDRVALVDGVADPTDRRQWTYGQLLADTEATARALLTHFRPGDRIAVWAPNSADWVILHQAIAMAGMVLVGINPAYRAHELEYILRQSRAAGLFYRESYRGADLSAILNEVRSSLPELHTVVSGSEWVEFARTGDPNTQFPTVSPTDAVQLQYTSGTTGFPKGALLHHKGLANEAAFVFERAGRTDPLVCVNAMPMYHIGGGGVTELGTFAAHGTFVILPAFEPALMLEMIETYRGTHSLMVPTMLIALLDHPDRHTHDLSSIHTVMSGAAAVPEALVDRVIRDLDCNFTILFGQSEMHGVISQTRITDTVVDQATTVGQPLPELEVKIIDPVSGEIVPVGEQGEVCCRGYQVMLGYSDMPDETAATIEADGWLRMGDLGVMDSRGFLKITGRIKEMIIRGGLNIYPREIEELLYRHPAVAEVAVIGVPDEKWGEQIGAVVRMKESHSVPTAAELKSWLRERLAAHKTPALWYFTRALPMTPSGKIQKFRVQEQIADGTLTAAPMTERDAAEQSSADLVS